MSVVIVLAAAALSGLLCLAVYRVLLRCGIIDAPNQRSSHTRPTVRGGGIAIILTVLAAALWILGPSGRQPLLAIALCTLVLAVVSFIDDLKSVGAALRFGCHLLAALIAWLALGIASVPLVFAPGVDVLLPVVVTGVLGCLWLAGYTNAFNFMDGINGIAAGQAVVTGVGMALLTGLAAGDFTAPPVLLSLAVAGAALGFLPYNFPGARMFMGDVGSAPVGFILAVLVLWLARSAGFWLLIPLALLHANFVLDTAITLFRRIARGERWHQAHREHFYQRLIRSGKSHAFVTGWEMGLQTLVLGLMVLYLHAGMLGRVGLVALVILIWLAFFAGCEIAFRRHVLSSSAGHQKPDARPLEK